MWFFLHILEHWVSLPPLLPPHVSILIAATKHPTNIQHAPIRDNTAALRAVHLGSGAVANLFQQNSPFGLFLMNYHAEPHETHWWKVPVPWVTRGHPSHPRRPRPHVSDPGSLVPKP